MTLKAFNKPLGKEVIAGHYNPKTGVFYKPVSSRSKCWKHNAYGIEKEIIEKLKAMGCKIIKINEINTNKKYTISFSEFLKHAHVDVLGNSTPQYYLTLKFFTQTTK